MQTVRGDEASVERRLCGGLLRCPCVGVLGPWGSARERVIRSPAGVVAVTPRRGRCRSCRVTHVLLPVWLFVRRAFAGVLIWACVLARVAGSKIAAIGARFGIRSSTVASWLRRVTGRAEWWRQVSMGVLALVDPRCAGSCRLARRSAMLSRCWTRCWPCPPWQHWLRQATC